VNYVCYDSQHGQPAGGGAFNQHGAPADRAGGACDSDSDHAARIDGYHDAMRAAGFSVDHELVLSVLAGMESGRSAINRLMSIPQPPTAIYFTDPLTWWARCSARMRWDCGFRMICRSSGSTIRTCASALGRCCRGVQDAAQLGFEAALWLTRKLAGVHDEPMRRAMSTFFEVHETTGLPPHARCVCCRTGSGCGRRMTSKIDRSQP
jgi:hypothetical protein